MAEMAFLLPFFVRAFEFVLWLGALLTHSGVFLLFLGEGGGGGRGSCADRHTELKGTVSEFQSGSKWDETQNRQKCVQKGPGLI
jgi:hypothetical protein